MLSKASSSSVRTWKIGSTHLQRLRLYSTIRGDDKYGKPTAAAINDAMRKKKLSEKKKNALIKMSLKDVFSSITGSEDSEEDYDLKKFDPIPYYSSPQKFQKLPYYYRHHMGEQIREEMKQNWKLLTEDQKRFSYWLAYGSHGPRKGFPNVYDYYTNGKEEKLDDDGKVDGVSNEEASVMPNKANALETDRFASLIAQSEGNAEKEAAERQALIMRNSNQADSKRDLVLKRSARKVDPMEMINSRGKDVPPDLPFRYPSVLKTLHPKSDTIVTKQPVLDPRSFGKIRLQQYQEDRRMNPYNRFLIATLIVLTVLAFKQDRKVNLTGKVPDYGAASQEEELAEITRKRKEKEDNEEMSRALSKSLEIQKKKKEEANRRKSQQGRKWYYLWLM